MHQMRFPGNRQPINYISPPITPPASSHAIDSAPGHRAPGAALPCPRAERVIAGAAFLAMLVVRVAYVFRLHVDSDEPQHLHVAWQWSQGLVAYRDFFDNHTPLFHMLMAPVLGWLGERSDIIDVARLLMVPLYLIALGAVRCLGRSLFSERVGLWAPIFAGAFAKYLFSSVEFRTDNLWASVWLVALAILFTGRPSLARSFSAGLLTGICFATSMKTGLLAGTLAGAAMIAICLAPGLRENARPARLAAHFACGLAGVIFIPGLLTAFFAGQGGLSRLTYCIFQHSVLPAGVIVENRTPSWRLLAVAFVALILLAWILFRFWGKNGPAFRRTVLLLHAGFIAAILVLVWPVLTRQNFLPVYPLAALFLGAPVISVAERLTTRFHRDSPAPILAALVAMMLAGVIWARPINVDLTLPADRLIADTLRLTHPGEYVMSYKGEVVFRPRPYYFAIETFTRARLSHGLLPDDIADRLIATGTCVALTFTHFLPPGARHFLEHNYLPVGALRVLGQELPEPDGAGNIPFTIRIAADYTLLMEEDAGAVTRLDGKPFSNSAMMEAGEHVLHIDGHAGAAKLLWTRAVQRGFRPLPRDHQIETPGAEF